MCVFIQNTLLLSAHIKKDLCACVCPLGAPVPSQHVSSICNSTIRCCSLIPYFWLWCELSGHIPNLESERTSLSSLTPRASQLPPLVSSGAPLLCPLPHFIDEHISSSFKVSLNPLNINRGFSWLHAVLTNLPRPRPDWTCGMFQSV